MKHSGLTVTALILLTALAVRSSAQCLQPQDYMHGVAFLELGDKAKNLHAFGNTVLAHHVDQLTLIDATDPERMTVLGAATIHPWTSDITSDGDYAYITVDNFDRGLHVVDLRDPDSMSVVGFLGGMQLPRAVTISNGTVFVAEELWTSPPFNTHRIIAVDVSDPTTPVFLDDIVASDSETYTTWIHAQGDFLYVGAHNGIDVIDATDPANLILATTIPLSFDPQETAIDGNTLYSVGTQLATVDITNPYAPTVSSSVPVPGFERESIQLLGNRATTLASKQLRICDLTNPTVYTELGVFTLPAHITHDIVQLGDYLVTSAPNGLYVANAVPTVPLPAVEFDPGGIGETLDVVIDGNRAYVSTDVYGSLMIYDTTDPLAPAFLGSVATGDQGSFLDQEGDLVAARFTNWGSTYGVHFIDVSDPVNPTIRSSFGSGANTVSLSGTRAYVAETWGVWILDVTDPATPVELGQLPMGGKAVGVGNTLYLATPNDGLKIFDVTDPTDIVELGAESAAAQTEQIVIDGNHAYLSDGNGIRIVDIADPTAPFTVGSSPTKDFPREMAHRDGYLYVATGAAGVEVFDVSNRWSPRPIMDLGIGEIGLTFASYLGIGPDYLWASNGRMQYTPLPCERIVSVGENPAQALLANLAVRPNPFNPQTTIQFELARPTRVTIVIHDLAGRSIRTLVAGAVFGAGSRRQTWNGRDDDGRQVSSGVYLARVKTDESELVIKMALVK